MKWGEKNSSKPVLDHGYLKFIGKWGSDEEIVEAARMSTGKGFLGWDESYRCKECDSRWKKWWPANTDGSETFVMEEASEKRCVRCEGLTILPEFLERLPGDIKMFRRLWRDKHTSPFEMGGLTIETMAPIFVFRQWHRHRTQSYNEMSGRYVALPDVNYIPSLKRLLMSPDPTNRQAGAEKGAPPLTIENAEAFRQDLARVYKDIEAVYQRALKNGVTKELARLPVPVARYSKMRASANLLNWLRFLRLRMETDAQWEAREYANLVGELVAIHFPRTWELFTERIGL